MQKRYSLMILASLFTMSSAFAEDVDKQPTDNLHIIQEQIVKEKVEQANEPVKKEQNEEKSKLEVKEQAVPDANTISEEKEELPASFKLKENFTPDGKSVTAFSDIEKLESVIAQKGVAWYNPRPNDKEFSIVFHPLTEKDSETLIKKTDDEDDLDYKNYKFAVLSVYYRNKKQGDQLTILLPSKYEKAVRLEKFGDKTDSINADLLVDENGRLVSILGPSEAVFLKKKQFTPTVPNPEKAPNLIFY